MRALPSPVVAALVAVAVFLGLHPDMWWPGPAADVRLPGWDLTRVFWADLVYLSRALDSASWPLWNPFERHGHEFAADPQARVYDPMTWVLVLVARLLGRVPIELTTLLCLVHVAIAAAGIDAYLRRLGISRWARLCAVLVFVACPRFDKLKDQAALWPCAWIAVSLERWLACCQRPCAWRGLGLGTALGMLVVSGYPPLALRLALAMAPVAVFDGLRSWAGWHAGTRSRHARAFARSLVVAAAVFVALAGPQIWAALDVLPGSGRAVMDSAHIVASRIELGLWPHLFVGPQASSATVLMLFMGSTTMSLSIAAVLTPGPGPKRRAIAVFVGVSLTCWLLATGGHGRLLYWLRDVPGFAGFRIPEHYWVAGALAASLGLAHALDHLLACARTLGPVALLGPGVSLLLWLAIAAFVGASPGVWTMGLVGHAWLIAITCSVGRSSARARWLSVGLRAGFALWLVVEMWMVGRPVADILQPRPSLARAELWAHLVADPQTYRIADFRRGARRSGLHAGVRDWVGHRPAFTERRYHALYRRAQAHPELLRAMNIALVAPREGWVDARWRRATGQGPPTAQSIYPVRDPWPRIFWSQQILRVDHVDQVSAELERPGPARVIVVAGDPGVDELLTTNWPVDGTASPPVKGSLRTHAMNSVELEIEAPASGLVVLNDAWSPRWRVQVDGRDAAVVRVNAIMRGVVVGPGRHQIRWYYAADDHIFGFCLAIIAWVALALISAARWVTQLRMRARHDHDHDHDLDRIRDGDNPIA